MLTNSDMNAADRRIYTRDLANISMNTYTDAQLDKKLESGDDIMKPLYSSDGSNPTNNQILVSNMITACIILKGIGGLDNLESAKKIKMTYNDIVKSDMGTNDAQDTVFSRKTTGVSGMETSTQSNGGFE